MIRGAVRRLFALGDWVMRYYPAGKKCKLDSIWAGPYLIVATLGWTVGIQRHPDKPVIFIHCQDVKKIPPPGGMQSWLTIPPTVPMLGASTVTHTSRDSTSVTALPPDDGVEMADVDSEQNIQCYVYVYVYIYINNNYIILYYIILYYIILYYIILYYIILYYIILYYIILYYIILYYIILYYII